MLLRLGGPWTETETDTDHCQVLVLSRAGYAETRQSTGLRIDSMSRNVRVCSTGELKS